MVTIVGAWSAGAIAFPVGGRWEAAGNDVTGIVRATGQAARLDDYAEASGPVGVHARRRLSVGGGNPDYGRGPAVGRHDRCLERTGAAPAGYRGSPGVVHGPRRDGGAPGEGRLADPRGHGLVGISDRVTALNGRLNVQSPPGAGTLVVAELPVWSESEARSPRSG
jgi:hypothetical protein